MASRDHPWTCTALYWSKYSSWECSRGFLLDSNLEGRPAIPWLYHVPIIDALQHETVCQDFLLVSWEIVLLQKINVDTGSNFDSIIDSEWPNHLIIDSYWRLSRCMRKLSLEYRPPLQPSKIVPHSSVNRMWSKFCLMYLFAHSIICGHPSKGSNLCFSAFSKLLRGAKPCCFGHTRSFSAFKHFFTCLKRVATGFSLNQIDSSTWHRRFLPRCNPI